MCMLCLEEVTSAPDQALTKWPELVSDSKPKFEGTTAPQFNLCTSPMHPISSTASIQGLSHGSGTTFFCG